MIERAQLWMSVALTTHLVLVSGCDEGDSSDSATDDGANDPTTTGAGTTGEASGSTSATGMLATTTVATGTSMTSTSAGASTSSGATESGGTETSGTETGGDTGGSDAMVSGIAKDCIRSVYGETPANGTFRVEAAGQSAGPWHVGVAAIAGKYDIEACMDDGSTFWLSVSSTPEQPWTDGLSLVIGDNRANAPYVLGSALIGPGLHDFSQEARTGTATSVHYDPGGHIQLQVEIDAASQSGQPILVHADLNF